MTHMSQNDCIAILTARVSNNWTKNKQEMRMELGNVEHMIIILNIQMEILLLLRHFTIGDDFK